eukprot:7654703-Pyramimonas_sp.AAC.1
MSPFVPLSDPARAPGGSFRHRLGTFSNRPRRPPMYDPSIARRPRRARVRRRRLAAARRRR